MINILLKFCFSVEIGAYLAYVGHYSRTKDKQVYYISIDELRHQVLLKRILASRQSKPSIIFNLVFLVIGHSVRLSCRVTPHSILNFVARIMELFNIFSYSTMAKLLPEHKHIFLQMQANEEEHSIYFS